MSLTLKAEQPTLGKKTATIGKGGDPGVLPILFCSIWPEWPLQVSWPEWYPADMRLNGKLKPLNYIIFKTQVPNFAGNRKKNLTNQVTQNRLKLYFISSFRLNWLRTSVLGYWTHTTTSISCIIHSWTLALRKHREPKFILDGKTILKWECKHFIDPYWLILRLYKM